MTAPYEAQVELVAAVLRSPGVARDLSGVLDRSHFENPALGVLVQVGLGLFHEYGSVPTPGQLGTALEGATLTPTLRKKAQALVSAVLSADLPPDDWGVAQGRLRAARGLLRGAGLDGLIEAGKFETVLRAAKRAAALAVNDGQLTKGPGSKRDIEDRHSLVTMTLPVGIPAVDACSVLERGRVGHLLGCKGVGKSQGCTHIGASGLEHDPELVVYHASLEMPAHEVRARYDRRLTGLDRKQCYEQATKVRRKTKDYHDRLFVHDTAAQGLTVPALEAALDRLPHEPGLIIIDYLNLMGSGRSMHGDVSDVRRAKVEENAKGIFQLARDRDTRVWTPFQANRDAAKRMMRGELLGKDGYAECYNASFHADVILSLNQTMPQKQQGLGVAYLAENRGYESGVEALCQFDWARSRVIQGLPQERN